MLRSSFIRRLEVADCGFLLFFFFFFLLVRRAGAGFGGSARSSLRRKSSPGGGLRAATFLDRRCCCSSSAAASETAAAGASGAAVPAVPAVPAAPFVLGCLLCGRGTPARGAGARAHSLGAPQSRAATYERVVESPKRQRRRATGDGLVSADEVGGLHVFFF